MKKIIKLFALIFSLILTFCLVACGEPRELTEEEKALLQARREIVLDYMQKQTSFYWRAGENFSYTVNHSGKDNLVNIVEGQIYLGLPYTYAGGTRDAFLEYASEPDEKGVYTISGLSGSALDGGTAYSRIGNDCSSAVYLAWSQVGNSVNPVKLSGAMKYFNKNNGFLPLGDYEIADDYTGSTYDVCNNNGKVVMYNSYAKLQKGDVLFRRDTSGHSIMVKSVDIKYLDDGSVNPRESKVIYLEQTFGNLKSDKSYFDETLGEYVNIICGVDQKTTFLSLFDERYLPITCKELIDPAIPSAPEIIDSIKTPSINNLFEGEIMSNWYMDSVYITISDSNGVDVQKCAGRIARFSQFTFKLSSFINDKLEGFFGNIDLDSLDSGNYSCKVDVKLTTGKTFTIRNFDFVV